MTLLELAKAPAGPASAAVMVNDGNVQRSMVTGLTVTFDVAVNLASDALTLLNRRTQAVFTPLIANPSGDGKNWVLTFSGTGITGGSLPDGAYRLSVKASSVHDVYGQALSGGDRTLKFHRLFGDINGDRQVTSTDLIAYRASLNQPANYLWYLDYDGVNGIDGNDYMQFRRRMMAGLLLEVPLARQDLG